MGVTTDQGDGVVANTTSLALNGMVTTLVPKLHAYVYAKPQWWSCRFHEYREIGGQCRTVISFDCLGFAFGIECSCLLSIDRFRMVCERIHVIFHASCRF